MNSLKAFCGAEKVEGGFLYGLGAVDEAELAHYDVETQKYSTRKFEQAFEVTNISGSIGMFEDATVVHVYMTVSDTEMRAFGGHLVEARVSGTCEIMVQVVPRLEKGVDEETGLKVFRL